LGAARPPQNLGYLAQAMDDHNIEYNILDMRLGYKEKHLINQIQDFKPDLLGVTVVSLEYKKTFQLISNVKKVFPELKTVAGGPHVTVLQSNILEENAEIDFGVVNEGEETLVDLCKEKVSIEKIKGLIYRSSQKVHFNGPREFPKNLDTISFPKYKNFELSKYIKEMPFNSSRGCPYKCVFCPNKIISKRFRFRSARHVVDEIEYFYHHGYRVFNYDDDNFTLMNDRVYEICDEIEKRKLVNAEFRCSNGIRADRVNRDLLKRMRDVGFNYIAFGVDGGNNRMLKINKKGETIEQIRKGIQYACDLGYDVKIFCILGMPYEQHEDVEDSLRLVQEYPIKRVILNNPIPYPGTELFEIVKREGWFLKEPEIYLNEVTENENDPVYETPELSRQDRIKILKQARKIEQKVTKKAVKRMYQRYPLFSDMAACIFATRFIEKMFFKNKYFRQWMERIRYKRMLKKQTILISEVS
jgi:radical SAM superfamily enzyme YgiQ (UPF0313 family)